MSPVSPMTSCTHFVATLALLPMLGGCPSGLPGNPLVVGGLLAHQPARGRLHPTPPNQLFGPGTWWQRFHLPSSSLGRRSRGCGAQERPGAGADGGAVGSGLWPGSSYSHGCVPPHPAVAGLCSGLCPRLPAAWENRKGWGPRTPSGERSLMSRTAQRPLPPPPPPPRPPPLHPAAASPQAPGSLPSPVLTDSCGA